MLEELRSNPRALAGRTGGRRPGAEADAEWGFGYPSLSTAFAESHREASTGAWSELPRPAESTK